MTQLRVQPDFCRVVQGKRRGRGTGGQSSRLGTDWADCSLQCWHLPTNQTPHTTTSAGHSPRSTWNQLSSLRRRLV